MPIFFKTFYVSKGCNKCHLLCKPELGTVGWTYLRVHHRTVRVSGHLQGWGGVCGGVGVRVCRGKESGGAGAGLHSWGILCSEPLCLHRCSRGLHRHGLWPALLLMHHLWATQIPGPHGSPPVSQPEPQLSGGISDNRIATSKPALHCRLECLRRLL